MSRLERRYRRLLLCYRRAGTRIGWETARPLPPEAQVRALFTDVVPGHRLDYFQLDDGLFSVMGREVSVTDVGFLFGLNTGLHQTSAALPRLRGNEARRGVPA